VQRSTTEEFTGDANAGDLEDVGRNNRVTEEDDIDEEFYSSTEDDQVSETKTKKPSETYSRTSGSVFVEYPSNEATRSKPVYST